MSADEEGRESPFRERGPVCDADALRRLRDDEIDVLGRMPWSSNATFLVDLLGGEDDEPIQAIYKPRSGERPLWDFPSGLYEREAGCYWLARHLEWPLVPPTIVRDDGPLGEGSLQLFVIADYEQHYFTLREVADHAEALQRLCVFDVLANSTDRKSGHVLVDGDGSIWAIDNGLSFHAEFKLRTVLWDWGGELIPVAIIEDVCRLLDRGLPDDLAAILNPIEQDAVMARARSIVSEGRFPVDPTGRRYPWPLV